MKIFITGSSDGIGQLAAIKLIQKGHEVVLHAKNTDRGKHALSKIPSAEKVLIGDLNKLNETKKLAEEVNSLGVFDAIIHNAGVYSGSKAILNVNCLAPYILTSLIQRPKRLIYISSGMHSGGRVNLDNMSNGISYSDSKLYLLMLSNAVARKWSDVYSNTVNPGWVPTKMGGAHAPDDLQKGAETQVWLAVSDDEKVKVTGRYFFHQHEARPDSEANNVELQEKLLKICEKLTGVHFPTEN